MRKTLIAATAAITLALAGCGAADSSTDKPEKTEISAARTAPADDNRPETTTSQKNVPPYAQLRVPARQAQVGRSEERRVGKEGRARGEPEHEKKKREERKTGAGEQQTR